MASIIGSVLVLSAMFGYVYNIVWLFNTAYIDTGYDYLSLAGVIVAPVGSIMGLLHLF